MAKIPVELITQLAGMDEYERLLAADTASRNLGVPMDELLNLVDRHLSGGETVNEQLTHVYLGSQSTGEEAPKPQNAAHHIQDAHRYRMKYDPSAEAQQRGKEITDAIACPHCNAPLGIPNIRPIKVNCPNCMNESTFFS